MKKFNLLMTIMLVFGMMANCGKAKESKMDEKSSGTLEVASDNPGMEVAVIPTKFGEKESKMNEKSSGTPESDGDNPRTEVAVISTKFGEIVLEFFDDLAPKHVESFKLHADNGYYNGTTFHRVRPGFMIQGGDPLSRSEDKSRHGTGGSAARYFGIGKESDPKTWDLPAEFSSRSHNRGILSMARSQNPDSGGSQFFICVADAFSLDGKYTVFGKVIEGMKVADQIVNAPRDRRDNPNDRIEMEVRLEKR